MEEPATYPMPRHSDGPSNPYSGNAPVFDDEDYVVAEITKIRHRIFNADTKDEWQCYQWLLEGPGTLDRPFPWSELTVKHVRPPNKEGKLNALTDWLVRLGMRTRDTLKPEDVPLDALQPAIGKIVRFQTFRKDGYYRVRIDTLHVCQA